MPSISASSPTAALAGGKVTARDRLLDSAMELMLEKGYNGTTVDEICSHAGVSKGSFYHFFESKEDLGLAALDLYYETGLKRLLSGPFNDESDPTRRLVGFLEHTEARAEEFWGKGCLLGTFAIDLAATNPKIRERVAEQLDHLAERLAPWFEPVATASRTSTTGRELAMNYINVLEGAIVIAKAFNDPGRIRTALAAFRRQLLQEGAA